MLGVGRALANACRAKKTKNLRGNMSTKRGLNQFQKGNRVRRLGKHYPTTSTYRLHPNLEEILDYQIPDLSQCDLKAYVSRVSK